MSDELQMEFGRNSRKPRPASLVPLIDISLFLLIFFMVAGTVEKFEIIPVEPPIAESGKLMDEGHIVITLGAHDEIIVEDELVDSAAAEAAIKDSIADNPDKVITLKADASIPAHRMIDMLDRIKASGGKNLSLVTQKLGGDDAQ